ncbi:MAG: phosphate ABC transporter ATPase [Clostridia bacterium]|nr:phosphate ABC transporter ATPase [Clostridia bacterium]
MKIKIGNFDFTECWNGVLYKKLSSYPHITEWEMQTILDFIRYEAQNGRTCDIEADAQILSQIDAYRPIYDSGIRVPVPARITECTACPTYKGCMTDFVCHTSSAENAKKILSCGSLYSAVRARGVSAEELQKEARNAANDPADYFDYVMLSWGNCQAGDRLVMERKLGRFPNETDLSVDFTPGVRYYFRYETLAGHPDAVFEGVLPMKVRDEIVLRDWVHAIIIPEMHRAELAEFIPDDLRGKIHYLTNDCKDIWAWSDKVYAYIKTL